MNNLTVTPPKGYEIDQRTSTFANIKFKKKGLSKSWEALESISGYYIDGLGSIQKAKKHSPSPIYKNTWDNIYQANASIAMAQLSQLMREVNKDWNPDWEDVSVAKWCIHVKSREVSVAHYYSIHQFLSFETEEIAVQFLKDHQRLIDDASTLL